MTDPLVPAVSSLDEPSLWTGVSEAAIASLHIRSMIGIAASAALVVRREFVDGHIHERIVNLVLACDDAMRAKAACRMLPNASTVWSSALSCISGPWEPYRARMARQPPMTDGLSPLRRTPSVNAMIWKSRKSTWST